MNDTRTRRFITILAAVPLALALGTGAAAAFEPPGGEPADLFGCDPNPALGHPGGDGLPNAMANSGGATAWNAHFNSDAVDNC